MIKLNCETNSYLDRRLRPFKFIFPFVVLTELLSTFIPLVQVCLFWRAPTINGALPHHEDQDFKKPNCISTVQANVVLLSIENNFENTGHASSYVEWTCWLWKFWLEVMITERKKEKKNLLCACSSMQTRFGSMITRATTACSGNAASAIINCSWNHICLFA